MATHTAADVQVKAARPTKLAVIDTDAHVGSAGAFFGGEFVQYLPERWRDYVDQIGMRLQGDLMQTPLQRAFAHRTDTVPPGGGLPGSDLDFVREQLLDLYDMSGAIMNDNGASIFARGSNNYPHELVLAYARAANDYHREHWLEADDRLYASIIAPVEDPAAAVAEIARCMESGERYAQVLLELRHERPFGHPRYWPVLEACEHYDIPVAFHVGAHTRTTPCGSTNYYFEAHIDFALRNFPLVSSLIFEGCFERFPKLKIAFIEQAWSWVVPFAWRMDSSYRKLGFETTHLTKKPSEYLRDHFWFSTQPIEEPEREEWFDGLWGLVVEHGMADKIMWSSDYPHWDFDDPDALPMTIPLDVRRALLGENASKLYNIPLRPDTGVLAPGE